MLQINKLVQVAGALHRDVLCVPHPPLAFLAASADLKQQRALHVLMKTHNSSSVLSPFLQGKAKV